jgi:pSer/pThr/pTyr-binding forkhead associated (FHA) protein
MLSTAVDEFRQALGVTRGIRLGITGPDGNSSEVAVESPCAVIGRSTDAHVVLADETVSYRQIYLQAIGDRVLCVDLFSANGLVWEDGRAQAWAAPSRLFRVGAYRGWLLPDGWATDDLTVPSPLDYKPREGGGGDYGLLPEVELKIVNKSLDGVAWPINRVVTLVGRDDRCRVTCAEETVSKVHCALVLLASGLWVVDLLGKGGTKVNDAAVQHARLRQDDVLQVGRYRMQVNYLSPPAALPPPNVDRVGFITKLHNCFRVEWDGETLIVSPQGRARDFRFQDVQREASVVISILKTNGFHNVLVDFSAVRLSGSLIIDSVTQFCRAAKGTAALCGCSEEQRSSLKDLNLLNLWPQYPDRRAALLALRAASAGISQSAGG